MTCRTWPATWRPRVRPAPPRPAAAAATVVAATAAACAGCRPLIAQPALLALHDHAGSPCAWHRRRAWPTAPLLACALAATRPLQWASTGDTLRWPRWASTLAAGALACAASCTPKPPACARPRPPAFPPHRSTALPPCPLCSTHPDQLLVCATGEPEDEAVLKGGWQGGGRAFASACPACRPASLPATAHLPAPPSPSPPSLHSTGGRSLDFTRPLRPYEEQRHTLRGVWALLKRSLHPFPPPGLRHSGLPIHGIMVGAGAWRPRAWHTCHEQKPGLLQAPR